MERQLKNTRFALCNPPLEAPSLFICGEDCLGMLLVPFGFLLHFPPLSTSPDLVLAALTIHIDSYPLTPTSSSYLAITHLCLLLIHQLTSFLLILFHYDSSSLTHSFTLYYKRTHLATLYLLS